MAHTPGPWKIMKSKIGDYAILQGGIIAEAYSRIGDDVFVDAKANACLIAAAPELYDLLNEWLDTPFFETKEEWQKWVDDYKPRVLQAVIKAGGDA